MKASTPNFLLIVTLSAGLGACATTPELDPVAQQLGSQQQQLNDLKREVAALQAVVDGIGAAGIGSTLGTVEQEMRNLRGEMESLQYEVRDMQQRRRNVDGAPRPSGAAAPVGTSAASPSAQNQDDQGAYLAAFGKLKAGEYQEAISSFEGFLSQYPASAYAPNAQYWIGEAYYVQRDFDKAWTAFAELETRYPSSLKAADARLKQGLIRVDQGRMNEAREIFQDVATRHAGSSAGRLATERLQRMGGS